MPAILTPLDEGEPVSLDKAIVFFGRHPDCDVVLTQSRKVSRKHCCIAQVHDYFVVRDLGSMNGVRVNGKPAGKEARLKLGDEVWVGDVRYRLEIGKIEKKPAAERPDPGVRRVDPDLLSRDVPIAIPEEGQDFVVEETRPKLKKQSPAPGKQRPSKRDDEIIVLGDDDIID